MEKVVNEREFLFPVWLYTFEGLNCGQKLIFAYLFTTVLENGGETTITDEELAEQTHKSVSTIKRALKKFDELGLIERKIRYVRGYVKERAITVKK